MTRIAHYVRSSHWDREWYDSFQGYRMRLVSMLDEVLEHLKTDSTFRYTMDGQSIPVDDYLEVRPENSEVLREFARQGRFKVGPWYVAPDEVLVSGESLIRNLEMGIEKAKALGGSSALTGFACDQFGHISQMPQIFAGFGIGGAFLWRGTIGPEDECHFIWQSPDGAAIPAYRFGPRGYGMLVYEVRDVFEAGTPVIVADFVERLVKYTLYEAGRSKLTDLLLFDGGDHLEIEPQMTEIIRLANVKLAEHDVKIVASDLDNYQAMMVKQRLSITRKAFGELRETCGRPGVPDEQWVISGCYSSRIHLKMRNAECEDELCLWAEPFATFAAEAAGHPYPASYLNLAWKHLLENHPHDSICGCSIDQVHQDMLYRFDQSFGISSRLTAAALKAITNAAAPEDLNSKSLVIGIFNATSEQMDEPIDLQIPIPLTWGTKFHEFFGYEEKLAFRLKGPDGQQIPYQLVAQRRDVPYHRHKRYKFPIVNKQHQISVTANISVPAFGYTTIVVEEAPPPTRFSGTMLTSHCSMENECLCVVVNTNGTLKIIDKRSGHTFDQCLTFEERADIGDGWFHGVAVNDQMISSLANAAEVSVVADGRFKATLKIDLTMQVPLSFDFSRMKRSDERVPLRIISEITLRLGSDRVEVATTVHNTILDHRIRVIFPTGLKGDTYLCDSAFDVIERAIAFPADNDQRKEPELETRPQITWSAFGDGKAGLAIVSRGLPESGVSDRPRSSGRAHAPSRHSQSGVQREQYGWAGIRHPSVSIRHRSICRRSTDQTIIPAWPTRKRCSPAEQSAFTGGDFPAGESIAENQIILSARWRRRGDQHS